jgi:curved DNA-binding protein CbpA
MALQRSYYQVLGVQPDAPEREIKRAYRRLARTLHPDKASGAEEAKRLEVEFTQISTAYNILKDRAKRQEYDAKLSKDDSQSAQSFSSSSATAASKTKTKGGPRPSAAHEEARLAIAKKSYVRGIQCYKMEEYDKAVEYFEAAIKNSDKEALYFSRLALALMKSHRSFTRAREMAEKAIEIDPYNAENRLILGEICEMAGINSLAIQTYKELLRWDSDNTRAMVRLADLDALEKTSFVRRIMGVFRRK